MTTLTINITGQYASSNATFTGSRKQVLEYLRRDALEKRANSRAFIKGAQHVHSIAKDKHQSRLVTMATFEIKNTRLEKLLELLNGHGVLKYSLA